MKSNEEFIRLEQLVDALIARCKEQKEALQDMEKKFRAREDECESLRLSLVELEKQRAEVGSRVAGLLGRIEQWEAETPKKGGKGN